MAFYSSNNSGRNRIYFKVIWLH